MTGADEVLIVREACAMLLDALQSEHPPAWAIKGAAALLEARLEAMEPSQQPSPVLAGLAEAFGLPVN